MRIAIVCDWLVNIGGAEKVLGELFHCFPQADLFAVIDCFDESTHRSLNLPKANTSFLQKLPFINKYYRYTLPLMPLAIEQLDVRAYDLVISSSHAIAKGIKTHDRQKHICYIHSPMRYVWDLKEQYLAQLPIKQRLLQPLMRYFLNNIKDWDTKNAQHVTHYIANSHYIAKRVWNAYGRQADVIYPPIDTTFFTPLHHKQDYYLTAARLVPYKRVDILVKCFAKLPHRQLVVIGDGPEMQKLKHIASSNVTFLGFQPKEVLKQHLQVAKAFLFAAEEDFGILPLEAQACGTPVIAYGKGGALETVKDMTHSAPTGLFFYEQTAEAVQEAILQFEKSDGIFSSNACLAHALTFNTERFRIEIKKTIDAMLAL